MTLRVALCYPNRPAVGRANLGFALVRELLRRSGGDLEISERFAVRPRRDERPLSQHDLLLFSVPFEGDYAALVGMLRKGGVAPLAAHRGRRPLVLIGGLAPTLNPEPLALIADLLAIGDAEELIPDFVEHLFPLLRSNAPREVMQQDAALIDGVYAPARYGFEFDETGRIRSVVDRWRADPPPRVRRRYTATLKVTVPPVAADDDIFAGCAVIEASRGCPWGCRFCAAGFAQRPYRERDLSSLWPQAEAALALKPRVGLVGADIGDLACLDPLLSRIHAAGGTATPSALRASAIDAGIASALVVSGKRSATLAPETGSERLRSAVNKQLDDATLLRAVDQLAAAGVERVRLYFLLGLPGETDADVASIVDLVVACRSRLLARGRARGRVGGLFVSVTPFVPKPATPFQREPFADMDILRRRGRVLRRGLARLDNVELKVESIVDARVQAALARGDRRLGDLLARADDSANTLRRLLDENPQISGPSLAGFSDDDILPWHLVDHRLGEDFLRRERNRSRAGKRTKPCDLSRCTACDLECGTHSDSVSGITT